MTPAEEFEHHAARAFFASAWADECERSGNSSMLSGNEIMDIMPEELDPAAIEAARKLRTKMEVLNRGAVDWLLAYVELKADGDREPTMEMFGHYCAMQAMGHGVGLADAFGRQVREAIKVPYLEFSWCSLSREYFEHTDEEEGS